MIKSLYVGLLMIVVFSFTETNITTAFHLFDQVPQMNALFSAHLPAHFRIKHHLCEAKPIQNTKSTVPVLLPPLTVESVEEKPLDFDPYSAAFANQLMTIFGTDSLAYRLANNEKKTVHIRTFGTHKKNNHKNKAKEKHWINEVMSEVSKILPFQNDINLGSNSNTDVYVELSAEKNWNVFSDWSLDTTQTFRYGAQSKNYSETDFNFSQKRNGEDLAANRFSIIKTYEAEITWNDKLFMKQQFLNEHQLTYGIYTGGVYNEEKKDLELQSWGPYLGWRIPLWKKWIYLDNDISYYKDITATDGYSFSANLQLEAFF